MSPLDDNPFAGLVLDGRLEHDRPKLGSLLPHVLEDLSGLPRAYVVCGIKSVVRSSARHDVQPAAEGSGSAQPEQEYYVFTTTVGTLLST